VQWENTYSHVKHIAQAKDLTKPSKNTWRRDATEKKNYKCGCKSV
jgi:hypothetical protein